MVTIIQALEIIERNIYNYAYDDLTLYLQGIRDMVNLINGEENPQEVTLTILKNLNFIKKTK